MAAILTGPCLTAMAHYKGGVMKTASKADYQGQGYDGVYALLKENGDPLKKGEKVTDFRGEQSGTKIRMEPPHKPGASGKVSVNGSHAYYAGVWGLKYERVA